MQYYKIIKLALSGLNLFLMPLLRMLAVFSPLVVFHDDDEDRYEILVLHDECVELLCILCEVFSFFPPRHSIYTIKTTPAPCLTLSQC